MDSASALNQTLTLELKPTHRATNLGHLEKSLEAVPAVESVEIDAGAMRAQVLHHGADLKEMLRVLGVQGYDAHLR